MKISEEQLKKLVLRVLRELEGEQGGSGTGDERQNLYMVCMSQWNDAYDNFLRVMDGCDTYNVYPVVPLSWKKQGYEAILSGHTSCKGICCRSCERPDNLEHSVTVFPVVPRDVLVKTALCISDTFETAWIGACIECGSKAILLRSGLQRFSGREPSAYVGRIMGYCRQVLEYGIEIRGIEELTGRKGLGQVFVPFPPVIKNQGKKRVITASNVQQLASGGILSLYPGDIVTDLARDRARFLNIVFE